MYFYICQTEQYKRFYKQFYCISNYINKPFLPLTDVPVSDQMYFLHNHVTVYILKGRANTASDSTSMARSTVSMIGRSEFGEGVIRYKIWADICPGIKY